MGIFLILLIIAVVLCWPLIKKWGARFVANRAEDYLRKATGMPPRPGSREEKRQQRTRRQDNTSSGNDRAYSSYGGSQRSRRNRRHAYGYNEPLIPHEYAEDVEFVETIDYSETIIGEEWDDGREYHENQVSDADWVDIK